MSGTSMDAVDCALVSFENDETKLIDYAQYPLDDDLKKRVRSINARTPTEEIEQLDAHLGHLFANATNALIKKTNVNPKEITAVGCHDKRYCMNQMPLNRFPYRLAMRILLLRKQEF